jgi:hypothetical protein
MGMVDYFKSSYDLGPQFTNVICHTKDIEHEMIGGTMSFYWLNPYGHLVRISYAGTHDFEKVPEKERKHKWMIYRPVSNGKRGRVISETINKCVTIYPSMWLGDIEDWPKLLLYFKYGKILEYDKIK